MNKVWLLVLVVVGYMGVSDVARAAKTQENHGDVAFCDVLRQIKHRLALPGLRGKERVELEKYKQTLSLYCQGQPERMTLCTLAKRMKKLSEKRKGSVYKRKIVGLLCETQRKVQRKYWQTLYWLALWVNGMSTEPVLECFYKGLSRVITFKPRLQPKNAKKKKTKELGARVKDSLMDLDSLCQLFATDHKRRLQAMQQVRRTSQDVSPYVRSVVKMLSDPVENVRYQAIELLGGWSERKGVSSCVPALVRSLVDNSWRVRANAARTLGKFPVRWKKVVPSLVFALQDKRWNVRASAIRALGRIGYKAAAAVPDLLERTKDKKPVVRYAAIEALGRIGASAKTVLPRLRELLKKKEPVRIRRITARSLGLFHRNSARAVPMLEKALQDRAIRKEAMRGLRSLLKKPALKLVVLRIKSIRLRNEPNLRAAGRLRVKIGEAGFVLEKYRIEGTVYYMKRKERVQCQNRRFIDIPKHHIVRVISRGRYFSRFGNCVFIPTTSFFGALIKARYLYRVQFFGNRVGWALDQWFQ
ncbi:MAG: hypothetical protein CL920_35470 [Deltaproteobacteria bacterium]|nr:hypothetical protein [Deltaproteobacteria bacterium]|tara:strand:+ start:4822 stop:6408 length:1587 start_codon:yes stop_codon:yes gene_type:complete